MTYFKTWTQHIDPNLPTSVVFVMIHDKLLIALGDVSFMFLTYQLSMVGYWPSMAVTGPIESYVPVDENHHFTSTVKDISLKGFCCCHPHVVVGVVVVTSRSSCWCRVLVLLSPCPSCSGPCPCVAVLVIVSL